LKIIEKSITPAPVVCAGWQISDAFAEMASLLLIPEFRSVAVCKPEHESAIMRRAAQGAGCHQDAYAFIYEPSGYGLSDPTMFMIVVIHYKS